MNLNALKIDPEFQGKIPPLTFEELEQLEKNIVNDGKVINPIIVWNGLIVDGHNRYAILQKHPDIPYTVHEKEFASRYEAIIWICKNQLGRRNLTPEQKKYLVGKQYEAEKCSNGGDRKSAVAKSGAQNEHLIKRQKTCEKIATEIGATPIYVRRSEEFAKGVDAAEEAVPGTRQKVLSGEVKPTLHPLPVLLPKNVPHWSKRSARRRNQKNPRTSPHQRLKKRKPRTQPLMMWLNQRASQKQRQQG